MITCSEPRRRRRRTRADPSRRWRVRARQADMDCEVTPVEGNRSAIVAALFRRCVSAPMVNNRDEAELNATAVMGDLDDLRDLIARDVNTELLPYQIQSQRIDEYEFPDLKTRSIPNALASINGRCEDLPDTQWILDNVLPALAFAFELLLKRGKTPLDAEVKVFCTAVARLRRYVRTAVSNKSMYQRMRSCKVAESHHLVYTQLDELLDRLDVPETHVIRVWRTMAPVSSIAIPDDTDPSSSSDSVTINHFDTPLALIQQWTRNGLREATSSSLFARPERPSWFLSLKYVEFNESDQIGQGAFGAVYRGSWNGTPVVIKFMGFEEDIETISTDLLLHEVRVWHRLKHPHVLEFFGASHVDKRYFVCEFAENGILTKYLTKMQTPGNDHLTWQKLHEAALGLQYLHGMNVAHNDLKCDNIMVGSDHKAKLIDFGLSCLLGEAEVQIDVKKIGAVNWRSPEYVEGRGPSRASDVYSFAMCIIEAVSGKQPWGAMNVNVIKRRLKRGVSPPLPASMTPKQRNLIELMTKPDPEERVKIKYVADMLGEIAQDASASAAP